MTNYIHPSLNFHIMTKPRGAICNLDCQYCYFLKKEALYPDSQFFMSDEVLESYTRQYIEAQNSAEVTFSWQGGEPTLMGLGFFKRALHFQNKYRRPGMRISNTIQTNGTLLTDEWCQLFKTNNFLVGLSLDGPRDLHDAYRVDKGGSPTFDRVMAGLALLKKHQVEFNILTCIHAANADYPIEVYRFLRDEVESHFIQFIPIIERKNETGFQEGAQVTDRTVSAEQYGQFLIAVFDEWIQRDVGKVFVQIFDVSLGIWYGQPASLCVFRETCGTALAMEHNGDLYSCDHFVEPDYFLGNIITTDMIGMVSGDKQRQFGFAKRTTLPQYCLECEVRFACNGGCPKNRIIKTPQGESGLNYLCAGYKAFFNHINHPMRRMAELIRMRQPPALIMEEYDS